MATVAEAPATAEIDRQGALMIAAVNGTICTQAFAELDGFVQIIERDEMNDFSLSRHL